MPVFWNSFILDKDCVGLIGIQRGKQHFAMSVLINIAHPHTSPTEMHTYWTAQKWACSQFISSQQRVSWIKNQQRWFVLHN